MLNIHINNYNLNLKLTYVYEIQYRREILSLVSLHELLRCTRRIVLGSSSSGGKSCLLCRAHFCFQAHKIFILETIHVAVAASALPLMWSRQLFICAFPANSSAHLCIWHDRPWFLYWIKPSVSFWPVMWSDRGLPDLRKFYGSTYFCVNRWSLNKM